MVQSIMGYYISKVAQKSLLVTVMQTRLVTFQTGNQPQEIFLCSVGDLYHGAAKNRNV